MKKSILILSGGLDSTVSAWIAAQETTPVLALTFDYGQKAASREKESASKIAQQLHTPHRIINLSWLAEITKTSLVAMNEELPHLDERDLDNLTKTRVSANSVWVPNRNGLFLNIAACFAESLNADILVTGFNKEEGATFPDNSAEFVESADAFFGYSTQKKVQVISHTLVWDKIEIARKGKELQIPFKDLWFCYEGGETPCRRCESCLRDFRAFREAEIIDPWRN